MGDVASRRRLQVSALLAFLVVGSIAPLGSTSASAGTVPPTRSFFEPSAATRTLAAQGAAAGRGGEQGIVILDFGRPAERGGILGTIAFDGGFQSLSAIESGVEAFVTAYFHDAPAQTSLAVALGTNDSCGPAQPCGPTVCGCNDEPTSLYAYGAALANAVVDLSAWAAQYRAANGDTDLVHVVAADDIEPAYDPGFSNTEALLDGYATTVGGSQPAMVDYGSADPDVWSEAQLLKVAWGFPPDVVMPEIYDPAQVNQWVSVVRYAARLGTPMRVQGVLAAPGASVSPPEAYAQLSAALSTVGQRGLAWYSEIVR